MLVQSVLDSVEAVASNAEQLENSNVTSETSTGFTATTTTATEAETSTTLESVIPPAALGVSPNKNTHLAKVVESCKEKLGISLDVSEGLAFQTEQS